MRLTYVRAYNKEGMNVEEGWSSRSSRGAVLGCRCDNRLGLGQAEDARGGDRQASSAARRSRSESRIRRRVRPQRSAPRSGTGRTSRRSTWNKSHKLKIAFVRGDTQLAGNNPQAVQVAHAFASNGKILAVTGPAGSQEMEDTASVWKGAGLAPVSGSETRVALTRALPGTPRETTPGYFFRTVPNDGQQGDNVATFIHKVLKKTNVRIIDDEEAYSQGLSLQVKDDLQADGVTVTTDHISQQNPDYNSVITAIPHSTQLVYIPWQVPAMAQQFFSQLRANGDKQIVMGSDGTDDPSTFKGAGSYVSGFPVDTSSSGSSRSRRRTTAIRRRSASRRTRRSWSTPPRSTRRARPATARRRGLLSARPSPRSSSASRSRCSASRWQFLTKNVGQVPGPRRHGRHRRLRHLPDPEERHATSASGNRPTDPTRTARP